MNQITDEQILRGVLHALGMTSVNHFAKEIGYTNASAVLNVMKNIQGRKISENLIGRITRRYPNVNELYLRKKSGVILLQEEEINSQSKIYTLNDLPKINIEILKEQKKTNELMMQLLERLS